MKPASLRIATFVLLLLILGERAFDRLVHADLWGEDGMILLTQAATLGSASLLMPYAGSYLTIERLIMLGALRAVPLSWLPAASDAFVHRGLCRCDVEDCEPGVSMVDFLLVSTRARGLYVLPLAGADRDDRQSLQPDLDLVLLVGAGWTEGSRVCLSRGSK